MRDERPSLWWWKKLKIRKTERRESLDPKDRERRAR